MKQTFRNWHRTEARGRHRPRRCLSHRTKVTLKKNRALIVTVETIRNYKFPLLDNVPQWIDSTFRTDSSMTVEDWKALRAECNGP